jgi:hypothetical protein
MVTNVADPREVSPKPATTKADKIRIIPQTSPHSNQAETT